MDNSKFIRLKLKTLFPFYIDELNDVFFDVLESRKNNTFYIKELPKILNQLDQEENEKFIEFENLTQDSKIALLLNNLLRKIVAKTGVANKDLFAEFDQNRFNEKIYIKPYQNQEQELDDYFGLELKGSQKFDFIIKFNRKGYLGEFFNSLRLCFFLDPQTRILSGGFSLSSDVLNSRLDFNDVINEVYLKTLTQHFFTKQILPISLEDLLTLIENDEATKDPKSSFLRNNKSFVNLNQSKVSSYGLKDLKRNWNSFLETKYLASLAEEENQIEKKLLDDLFYAFLMVLLIMLALYEEVKIFFTNDNPALILKVLDRPLALNEDQYEDVLTDFYEVAKLLRKTYIKNQNQTKSNKKIKTAEDLIEDINSKLASRTDLVIDNMILCNEIYVDLEKRYLSALELFEDHFDLRTLYLLTIYPEVFGMDIATANFIPYKQLLDVVKKSKVTNRKITNSFQENLKKSLCEVNYDVVSFIGDEPSIFLINNTNSSKNKANNALIEQSIIFDNYYWASILMQARISKKLEWEKEFESNKQNRVYLDDLLKKLDNLTNSWNTNAYQYGQVLLIMEKFNQLTSFKKNIEQLKIKLLQRSELLKKDRERTTIVFAYIVASVIGFINFFGMVYTVLTVTDPEAGLIPSNIAIISVGSVLASCLFVIFLGYAISSLKLYLRKRKLEKK